MTPKRMSMRSALLILVTAPVLAACASDTQKAEATAVRTAVSTEGLRAVTVIDSLLPDIAEAVGTATPLLSSTMSTKLMATVSAVHVHVGDRVRRGQLLVSLDVRDIDAKASQASGNLAGAEAMLADAEIQVARIRALYADSAAPKAQLDAAEAGLARARGAVLGARGGVAEAAAVREYGAVRAPFEGVVTQRFVDPGAFAAPGAPLIMVQQSGSLRVTALVPPTAAMRAARGATVDVSIEGVATTGTIEGVVAAPSGGLYTVNVIVPNRDGAFASGGSATVFLPGGERMVRLIPAAAVTREGDLTGVLIRANDVTERRWVRLGRTRGMLVEVLSGVDAGDVVMVRDAPAVQS